MTPKEPSKDQQFEVVTGETTVIRRARAEDLPAMVTIHQKAFSQFFLTRLGGEFLRRYYRLVLDYRAGIVLVSERQGVLEGFACGFVDPAEFYRLMWHHRRIFVLPAMSGLVRHPSLATRVLDGIQRIQTSALQGSAGCCELSSIAVAPEAGGRTRGKLLMQEFLVEAWAMNAKHVYLTTDADGNEAANALYRRSGFQNTRRFLQRKGRWMNEYVINRMRAEDGCVQRL